MNRAESSNMRLVSALMFKLLPLQVLLASISILNEIISSLFASNMVSSDALAIVGLYDPVCKILLAFSVLLSVGSQVVSSKYMGKNQIDMTQGIFTLNICLSVALSAIVALLLLLSIPLGWTIALTGDEAVAAEFNRYMVGRSLGILPFVLGNQLSAFLSLENKTRLTTVASIIFIVASTVFHIVFVGILGLGVIGLALASSCSSWVFVMPLALCYLRGKSILRFNLKSVRWRESLKVVKNGFPTASTHGYKAVRNIIINALIIAAAGTKGLSAYVTVITFCNIIWTVPDGMRVVTLMLFGVSAGEEDRQTLVDIMRVVIRKYMPLMLIVCAITCLCAEPLTRLYYHDPSDPVYQMTLWGFRIYPWCGPLYTLVLNFTSYGNVMEKTFLTHGLALFNSFACVPLFTALLVPFFQLNAAYISYTLREVATVALIVLYAWRCNRRFPRNTEDLLVVPADFGAGPDERLDLSVHTLNEAVDLSKSVRAFCEERGVDERRTLLAGLCLEEMVGNVVDHGFTRDHRRHSIDIRVVHKNDDLILRIMDDCVPFDPAERTAMVDPVDKAKNIGIRLVFSIASSVEYQQILGLNVLTIRI